MGFFSRIVGVSVGLFSLFYLLYSRSSILKRLDKLENREKYIFSQLSGGVKNLPKARGELRGRQLLFFNEVLKFDKIAKKYNINYWIDFGNLLGSIRHDGFIPWDDDFDISMIEADFDKLRKLVEDGKIIATIKASNPRYYSALFFFKFNDSKIDFDIFVHSCMSEKNYKKQISYTNIERFFKIPGFGSRIIKNFDKLKKDKCDKTDMVVMRTDKYRGPDAIDKSGFNYLDIFPLKDYIFENKKLLGPNDFHSVLIKRYSRNYMKLPDDFGFSHHLGQYIE